MMHCVEKLTKDLESIKWWQKYALFYHAILHDGTKDGIIFQWDEQNWVRTTGSQEWFNDLPEATLKQLQKLGFQVVCLLNFSMVC